MLIDANEVPLGEAFIFDDFDVEGVLRRLSPSKMIWSSTNSR
jgi:hypothetical protein